MNINILHTNNQNEDFQMLIGMLDEDLYARNGEEQKQYRKFNKVDMINDVFVVYVDGQPIGCGAFKHYDDRSAEIKRIFIMSEYRGQGLSKLLMEEIERSAKAGGYQYALLETGLKQFEAVALYKGRGYQVIENYEPYVGYTESVCMKKALE